MQWGWGGGGGGLGDLEGPSSEHWSGSPGQITFWKDADNRQAFYKLLKNYKHKYRDF